MITNEYSPAEIREQTIISWHSETLTVSRVTFRRGRGLELRTNRPDGYQGPVIYPHPDETVTVLYMPSLSDDDMAYLRVSTSNYPWAESD